MASVVKYEIFRVSQNGIWPNMFTNAMNSTIPYTLHCV